jgi:hypothetical protein
MPHAIRFWLSWWVGLTGLYLLLVFKTEPAELVAAAICGAISASAAEMVRRHGRLKFAPGWGWTPAALRLPGAVVVDTSRLVAVLWRVIVRREHVSGRIITVEYKDAHRRGVNASSRRAVAKWIGSVAPNSLVIGFAEKHDRVLLHQLVPVKPEDPDPWKRS